LHPNKANISLLFVDSEGDGAFEVRHGDLRRRILAASSIVALRIHFTPPQRPAVAEYQKISDEEKLVWIITRGATASYRLAVVVPRMGVSGLNEKSDVDAYDAARRRQDEKYTEQFRRWRDGGNPASVLLQPDASRFTEAYWRAMRDLAQQIVDLAHTVPVLPGVDAIRIFDNVADWIQSHGNNLSDEQTTRALLRDLVQQELAARRVPLVERVYHFILTEYSRGRRAFEMNTDSEIARILRGARTMFVEDVATNLTPRLGNALKKKWIDRETTELQSALALKVDVLLETVRGHLVTDFGASCGREVIRIRKDMTKSARWWYWKGKLEARAMDKLKVAVQYADLPYAMQAQVDAIYQESRASLREAVQAAWDETVMGRVMVAVGSVGRWISGLFARGT
jgi:hypothetical protein